MKTGRSKFEEASKNTDVENWKFLTFRCTSPPEVPQTQKRQINTQIDDYMQIILLQLHFYDKSLKTYWDVTKKKKKLYLAANYQTLYAHELK